MPREDRVGCDYCDRNLTSIEGGGWRLELRAEHVWPPRRSWEDMRAFRDRPKPLPQDVFFCSFVCLAGWLARHPPREGDFAPNERPLGEQGG